MCKEKVVSQTTNPRVERTLERMRSVIQNIYTFLEGKSVTEETLAEAIQQYFPDMTAEKLAENCSWLKQGVQDGDAWYEQFAADAKDSDDVCLAMLQSVLGKISPDKRKEFLKTAYRLISQKLGYLMDAEGALYVEGLPMDDLVGRVRRLMEQDSRAESQELLDAVSQRMATEENTDIQNQYTDEENAWIAATGFYASAVQCGIKVSTVEEFHEIGQTVGFWSRCAAGLRKAILGHAAPAAIVASSIFGSGMILVNSLTVMEAGTSLLASLGLFAAGSFLPELISVCVASVALPVAATVVPLLGFFAAAGLYEAYGAREEESDSEYQEEAGEYFEDNEEEE